MAEQRLASATATAAVAALHAAADAAATAMTEAADHANRIELGGPAWTTNECKRPTRERMLQDAATARTAAADAHRAANEAYARELAKPKCTCWQCTLDKCHLIVKYQEEWKTARRVLETAYSARDLERQDGNFLVSHAQQEVRAARRALATATEAMRSVDMPPDYLEYAFVRDLGERE
jgi:hypothetical protein